ncbi:MAG: hypothetical protein ACTH7L_09395 [Psychrobacter alimentarius]
MFGLKRVLLVGLCVLGFAGCSDPEPVTIDIDEAAKNAGLTPDDYEVSDNGSIKIKAPDEVKSGDSASVASDQPLAAQGENWEYIVNNGIRIADEYAVKNNPAATFIGNNVQASLNEQIAGEYKGDYLLTILNDNPGNINYAQLRPLFDMDISSDTLDDESQLWEVTIAKHNGKEF